MSTRFLVDNILQQRAIIRDMGREPSKLLIDPNSLDVLIGEIGPPPCFALPSYDEPLRICGLTVEMSETPNVEVI